MRFSQLIAVIWLALTCAPATAHEEKHGTLVGPLTAEQERALKSKDTFQECENCPEMVAVPAGSFTMGSPDGEYDHIVERPQHIVTIKRPFAVGKVHVTVDQFAAFVRETGIPTNSHCNTYDYVGKWKDRPVLRTWRSPGFAQDGSHPVVCVTWYEASAYVAWLSYKTHKPYRLLSEAEWEYAVRGRTSPGAYTRFWFGDDEQDLCRYANGADQMARNTIEAAKRWTIAPCNDGYSYTSPAGHYRPNAFGLYDMAGNAWQWTADCWHNDYTDAPADGSAWTRGCVVDGRYVVRGGSWDIGPDALRSNYRAAVYDYAGFRVGRTLAP